MNTTKNLLKSIALLLTVLMFLGNSIYANGGPGASSPITKTGNIELIKKNNISIREENLFIGIDDDYLDVKVVYYLKNNGAKDKVTYYFPIEYQYDESNETDISGTIIDFKMSDGVNGLKIKEEFITKSDVHTRYFDRKYEDFKEINISQIESKWFVTELEFGVGEEKVLSVNYRVKSQFLDWGISNRFFEMFDTNFFIYDLTPAENWGNGTVGKFKLTLDATKLIEKDGKLLELNFEGYRYENGVYTFEKDDFNLSQQGNIAFIYDNTNCKLTDQIEDSRVDNKYIKSIKASSRLGEMYPAKNLIDGDFDTAWVEGAKGLGIGEWIEIEFTKGIFLGGICMANGYLKSEDVFKSNGKVKDIKIELYHKGELLGNGSGLYEPVSDKKYNELNKRYYGNFLDILSDSAGFYAVDKVRFRILDAYEGEKYTDTCISELFLLASDYGSYEGN